MLWMAGQVLASAFAGTQRDAYRDTSRQIGDIISNLGGG
jgi:hypothetical protein